MFTFLKDSESQRNLLVVNRFVSGAQAAFRILENEVMVLSPIDLVASESTEK